MKVIALDCATATGFCITDGTTIRSGTKTFPLQRGESPGIRFVRFRRWLLDIHNDADLFVHEQAHHRGGAATELCVGMTTRVQEVAAELGKECACCHTQALKRYATGKGNADKSEMMTAAEKRWGVTPADDNEADAMMLAAWAVDGCPLRDVAAEKAAAREAKDAERRKAEEQLRRDVLAQIPGHIFHTTGTSTVLAGLPHHPKATVKRTIEALKMEGHIIGSARGWQLAPCFEKRR